MAKSRKSRPTSAGQKPAPLEGNAGWRERSRVRKTGVTLREAGWWDRLSDRAQHALCLGVLLVVAAGFFSATTFGGRTLVGGDTVQWRAASESQIAHEADTGDVALWVPGMFGGMPAYLVRYPAATPGADSVVSWLRSIGLWPVAHMLVLLVGTYLLSVFLTRNKLAGVIAAVGYGLTTYLPLILTAGHNTKFVALAYAPWLLLAFAALIRRAPGTPWMTTALEACLFAIAAAIQLRAGHVQITYYVVVAAAVWWLAEGIAAVRAKTLPTFLASTGWMVAGSALALAMVAHPYLAQWEYKAYSTRSSGPGGGLMWDYAMAWSQGVGELLTLLIPNAYGGGGERLASTPLLQQIGLPRYWGPKPFTAGPHYFGPVVVALALVGALGVARRSVAAFAAATVLMVLFSLGEHLPLVNRPAFELLPLFSTFRVPETWLSVVALLAALLAGWGAYYLVRREATPEAETRKRRVVLTVFGVLAVVVGGLWMTGGGPLAFESPTERQQLAAAVAQQGGLPVGDPQVSQFVGEVMSAATAERAAAFSSDAGRTLLFLALAFALAAGILWKRVPPWAALAGLALLAVVDLWGVGRRYFNEESGALRTRASLEAAIPTTDADRWIAAQVEAAGGDGRFRVLPALPSPAAAMSYAVGSMSYESVGGYSGAKMALVQDYFDRLLPADAPPDAPFGLNRNALRLLGVRYVVAPAPLPGLAPVYQDPATGALVLEDSTTLGRAWLVDSVAVVPDREAMEARLRDDGFDLARTALVGALPDGLSAEALTGPPAATDSAGAPATRVALERFTPDEIVYRVTSDRPRLLVLSEIYYPAGWSAQVRAAPAPIVQTNTMLRGVPVPAGESLVTMRFAPETHRRGVLIAWLATLVAYLGALGLFGVLWYRRGHKS